MKNTLQHLVSSKGIQEFRGLESIHETLWDEPN